jgi:hypothetical protein
LKNLLYRLYILLQRFRWRNVKVTFIVSTGRTGTKFLGNVFNSPGSKAFSTHEPKPNMEKWACEYLAGKRSAEACMALFFKTRAKFLKEMHLEGKTHYIESNGGLIYLLDELARHLPHLQVIHVVRDPIDFIYSVVARKTTDGQQKYALPDRWIFTPYLFKDEPNGKSWNSYDIYEKIAWVWQKKNTFLKQWIQKHKYARTVRFEDIFESKNSIITFLQLIHPEVFVYDISIKPINQIQAFLHEDISQWPKARLERIGLLCNVIAKNYSYTIAQ